MNKSPGWTIHYVMPKLSQTDWRKLGKPKYWQRKSKLGARVRLPQCVFIAVAMTRGFAVAKDAAAMRVYCCCEEARVCGCKRCCSKLASIWMAWVLMTFPVEASIPVSWIEGNPSAEDNTAWGSNLKRGQHNFEIIFGKFLFRIDHYFTSSCLTSLLECFYVRCLIRR